ncbi:MAG TPA: hypothetical protein VGG11_18225 [Xanthobacteraceae bacterium]|jgi:hypothetical protein
MGRLVRKPQIADFDAPLFEDGDLPSEAAAAPMTPGEPGDTYLERMVKYVPGEVLAFFMLINAILDQAMKSGGPDAAMAGVPVPMIAIGALTVGCVLTPLFCWYVRQEGDAWIVNAVVSTVAFPFWAYLMGAVAFATHHDGNLAVILVMSFTVMSGLIAPWPAKAKLEVQLERPPVRERLRLVDVFGGLEAALIPNQASRGHG